MAVNFVPHTLRDYQRDAIDSIKGAWGKGQKPLAALATGAGKTTIMSQLLVETVDPERQRALIIAHTKEIVEQIFARIENQFAGRLSEWFCGVRMYPGIGMVMGARDLPQARIIVATRQSLHTKRLAQILRYGAIDVALIDEAHHAVADNTYGTIVDMLTRCNKNIKIAGVTATPKRTDKKALGTIFDDICYKWLIPDGIQSGHLTPVTRVKVKTKVNLSGVKSSRGDYSQSKMVSILKTSNWVELAVEAYQKYIEPDDRQTLAYLPSVAMSKAFTHVLQGKGIAAAHIDGNTPKDDRETILGNYQAGITRVVSNMAVLTEGFDAPATGAILLARPTRSQTLFTQIVGRGLRPSEGKDDCLLLDMTVVDTKALEVGTLLGVMLTCPECATEYLKGTPCCPQCQAPPPKAERESGESDDAPLPSNFVIGGELIAEFESLFKDAMAAWYVGNDGYVSCNISFDKGSLIIMPPVIDDYYRLFRVPKSRKEAPQLEYQNTDIKECMIEGERIVKRGGEKSAMKDAEWRSQPASTAQVKLLKKFGIENVQGFSKGFAGQLITHNISRERIEQAEGFAV